MNTGRRDPLSLWVGGREAGLGSPCGRPPDPVHRQLYSAVRAVHTWDPGKTVDHTHHGAIFNFDFSTDGAILVAACERKSVLMFDPYNAQLLSTQENAHTDCVNCVKFLDSRLFVTCSDDTTVRLWDTRYLKHCLRTLRGHSNWVKNVEYSHDHGALVTSGFDGSVYIWDINRYSEADVGCRQLFHTKGLMRSKLTPDNKKMIISTAEGYLLIIHDLDLTYLPADLEGFSLSGLLYSHAMQGAAQSPMHFFTQSRNRVEIVRDFPDGDDAGMIASLEVHPQGWCVVSRNTTEDNSSEWTCVHDIQQIGARFHGHPDDCPSPGGSAAAVPPNPVAIPSSPPKEFGIRVLSQNFGQSSSSSSSSPSSPLASSSTSSSSHSAYAGQGNFISIDIGPNNEGRDSSLPQTIQSHASPQVATTSRLSVNIEPNTHVTFTHAEHSYSSELRHHISYSGASASQIDLTNPNPDYTNIFAQNVNSNLLTVAPSGGGASNDGELDVDENQYSRESTDSPGSPPEAGFHPGNSISLLIRSQPELRERMLLLFSGRGHNPPTWTQPNWSNIPGMRSRLTHFIQEPNVRRGYIKELCFSNDGRLVVSPFSFGFRMMAFDDNCQELCDTVPQKPTILHEVASTFSHRSYVVTTKYSPTHCLIVSGCLNGSVGFHQPVL